MPGYVEGVDVETAIRTRRTHKAFGPEPLGREEVLELLELARWAPNHHLTAPWRFRVLGAGALARLKEAAAQLAIEGAPAGTGVEKVGQAAAAKLDRAPTLVVCSVRQAGDAVQDEEDRYATACAAYAVLLGAHARGLAGYWRTPGLLRSTGGRGAVGLPDAERFVGLLHLGRPRQEKEPPERPPVDQTTVFLD